MRAKRTGKRILATIGTTTCWLALAGLFTVCNLSPVSAEQISLQVGATHPTMLAGEKQTNHVRISMTGFDLPETKKRPRVNVAIVIDTSGSMGGKKIKQARQAAITAVKRLRKDDIVSVVLYNTSALVLVPATKASDSKDIIRKIETISAKGSTALFAGVSKGAAEVRKFLDKDSVNRVILLSDGLANVGPKSPGELERLGASLVKEGMSVSTLGLGLGYNEDLMSGLASAGSGNHIFVEQAENLVAVFNTEFNDLMSVVAGDFEIHAKVAKGVRPVRVLGTKADISGQDIFIPLAQLYSRQQRYFIVEVEVEPGEAEQTRPLMNVEVQYQNMITETTDKLSSSVDVRFSDDVVKIKKDVDYEAYAFCSIQIANDRNVRATALRDAGQVEEAQKLLTGNVKLLNDTAFVCEANGVDSVKGELTRNVRLNQDQSVTIAAPSYSRGGRKAMREIQKDNATQQSLRVTPGSKSGR